MHIKNLTLNNFRCFSKLDLSFENSFVVIRGDNGAGKTSLLESLHYLCYLRSFRAGSPKNLIKIGQQHFFIKVECYAENNSELHRVQVGCAGTRKLVKIDDTAISSFKDLMNHYRVVTLTEDDVQVIKGAPELRRSFIDQALILYDYQFIQTIKNFRTVLDNRNMLLRNNRQDQVSYDIWTKQLKDVSTEIQNKRREMLSSLSLKINSLVKDYFDEALTIKIVYQVKQRPGEEGRRLQDNEYRWGRSLFGAHLDDFTVEFEQKRSRIFASRGQQKLIAFLLKLSQIQLLTEQNGSCLFLVDDFMTDFDEDRAIRLITALQHLPGQKILTSPRKDFQFEDFLGLDRVHQIYLPN